MARRPWKAPSGHAKRLSSGEWVEEARDAGSNVVLVLIETPLRPTEADAKVRSAIVALWPDAEVVDRKGKFVATTRDMRPLRRRVWELRIIDAVRGRMLHGLAPDGKSLKVRLSKQAALARMVSFPPTPHALGDLEVTVEVEDGDPWPDAEQFVWWFAPETKDGEIVGAVEP